MCLHEVARLAASDLWPNLPCPSAHNGHHTLTFNGPSSLGRDNGTFPFSCRFHDIPTYVVSVIRHANDLVRDVRSVPLSRTERYPFYFPPHPANFLHSLKTGKRSRSFHVLSIIFPPEPRMTILPAFLFIVGDTTS